MDELMREKDFLSADNDRKQQFLHQELAGQEAELDDDDDDPLLHRLRRECEKRIKDCEQRLKQSQAEGEIQSILIDKIKHDLRDAQGEADDAQRGAITTSMEKMRTEAVNWRMKMKEPTASGYLMVPNLRIKQHWRNVTPPSQTYAPHRIVAEES